MLREALRTKIRPSIVASGRDSQQIRNEYHIAQRMLDIERATHVYHGSFHAGLALHVPALTYCAGHILHTRQQKILYEKADDSLSYREKRITIYKDMQDFEKHAHTCSSKDNGMTLNTFLMCQNTRSCCHVFLFLNYLCLSLCSNVHVATAWLLGTPCTNFSRNLLHKSEHHVPSNVSSRQISMLFPDRFGLLN